jgi:hypothetical protein
LNGKRADSTGYLDWSKGKRAKFPNLKPTLRTVRLPVAMIEDLKILASQRDVPYQSLLKVFVAERLAAERKLQKGGIEFCALPGLKSETSGTREPRKSRIRLSYHLGHVFVSGTRRSLYSWRTRCPRDLARLAKCTTGKDRELA